ncbi:hypothetical protein M0813_08154 [Anaeramoeba flamelloides]|uniref:Photosystem I assembly protein Ycf4 n=1 Tax=Anaeramoeba flamelloides TaxID=1746091 RepID=A0AAV8A0W3_9EUKA|nr:hypothetical protein M0812_08745 [Anaeramoeba flamelloides]KAJ6229237.1 hypothetical protein M0813_08154 [Anaeramoeba flamelloides]
MQIDKNKLEFKQRTQNVYVRRTNDRSVGWGLFLIIGSALAFIAIGYLFFIKFDFVHLSAKKDPLTEFFRTDWYYSLLIPFCFNITLIFICFNWAFFQIFVRNS